MAGALLRAAILSICLAPPALAGQLVIAVKDASGRPASDAVVEIVPDKGISLPASRVSEEAQIDQRNETFVPLVSLIRKGGHVDFLNNDTTMHQVYSFSAIKQFQFEIKQGQRSDPVRFDTAGIAAIGCNIHDHMITYVYVASSPFAAISDAAGHVAFADVPAGAYVARVWHPRLPPGDAPASHPIIMGTGAMSDSFTLTLMAPPARRPMHMGAY